MTPPVELRRGTPDDVRACLDLLWAAATDLGRRQGAALEGTADDWWADEEPLHRHLADHNAEWWVAEEPGGGLVGYARSVEREGLLELTEFFVRPGDQSKGLGGALLERAFPARRRDGAVRSIIATGDVRALGRYYAAGLSAQFPIFGISGVPAAVAPDDELEVEPIGDGPSRDAVRALEREVLGFARSDDEVAFLAGQRRGFLYRRGGDLVGTAFIGTAAAGPIAARDPAELAPILLHVEGQAQALGVERLEFQVPAPNVVATRHLLARDFRFEQWLNYLFVDRPFGRFDRYLGYSPPIFL